MGDTKDLTARIAHVAELAEQHCDVEEYRDTIAAEAFVALYPSEVQPTAGRRIGRYALSEHVRDALDLAVLERECAEAEKWVCS